MLFSFYLWLGCSCSLCFSHLFQQPIHNIAILIRHNECILKLFLQLLVGCCFLLLFGGSVFGGGFLVLDHLGEVVEFRAVELPHFLKLLLNVHMLELGQILMEVLGDGFPGWLDNGVPFMSIEVFGEGQLIHDQIIFHVIYFYYLR